MPGLFTAALHVTTTLGLTAFVFASVCSLINNNRTNKNQDLQRLLRYALAGSFFIVFFSLLGEFYLRHEAVANSVYRVRVNVIGTNGLPEENTKVSSSIGGEPKVVAGGFEFDIPLASKPADGNVTFIASVDNGSATGNKTLTLADDRFPAISINLLAVQSAIVRGTVQDDSRRALSGVTVSVTGYEGNMVTTTNGSFVLPAHVAEGTTVRLHAEATGYTPLDQDHPAGNSPAILVFTA